METVPSEKLAEICRGWEVNFTSVILNVRGEGIKRLIGHQFHFAEINSSVVLSEFYVRGTISYSQRGLIFDGVENVFLEEKSQVRKVICRGNFFHIGWRFKLGLYICIEEHKTCRYFHIVVNKCYSLIESNSRIFHANTFVLDSCFQPLLIMIILKIVI